MNKLKICMIGGTAVGKTSLVMRFVRSIFNSRYTTTIGVNVLTRQVERDGRIANLVLWDLSGEDEFQSVRASYLRGAAGYLLVIDGTRRETVATALSLDERTRRTIGSVPSVVVLNKVDLAASWEVEPPSLDALSERSAIVQRTSAKTGEGVDEVFDRLVDAILKEQGESWTQDRSFPRSTA
jgi:small GTP-binding protein